MKRFIDGAAVWVAVLGLVVGLSGCGSDPAPSEGTTTGSGDAVNTARGDARGGEVDTMRGSLDVPVVSEVREATGSPPVVNPLIAKLPGEWVRVVPDDGYPATVKVFPEYPACDWGLGGAGSTGDACVRGFSPITILILDGTALRADLGNGVRAEGRVVEEGGELRVEFSGCTVGTGVECHQDPPHEYVYVKLSD